MRKLFLRNKIQKMKTEKGVLMSLMKRAQIDRFKHNKISEVVYNLRMKLYKEKLQTIKQELPVLKALYFVLKAKIFEAFICNIERYLYKFCFI